MLGGLFVGAGVELDLGSDHPRVTTINEQVDFSPIPRAEIANLYLVSLGLHTHRMSHKCVDEVTKQVPVTGSVCSHRGGAISLQAKGSRP